MRGAVGASRVEVFDVTRRSDARSGAPNRVGLRSPASRVHVDYTVASAPRVRDVLGATEGERLVAANVPIVQVNVWRPIRGPVERSPLALADAASVRFDDLVATDQIFPDRTGEIYHLRYAPEQRWYYTPRMMQGEVTLIKSLDSREDGRAGSRRTVVLRFRPHRRPQRRARASRSGRLRSSSRVSRQSRSNRTSVRPRNGAGYAGLDDRVEPSPRGDAFVVLAHRIIRRRWYGEVFADITRVGRGREKLGALLCRPWTGGPFARFGTVGAVSPDYVGWQPGPPNSSQSTGWLRTPMRLITRTKRS